MTRRWTPADNLHDLGAGTTLVTGTGANWAVVRNGDAYTLIDCGYPGDTKMLDDSLEAIGVTGLPDAVVITHAHGDHIGNLPCYLGAGVPVHLAAAEIPNITGAEREQIGPKQSLPRALRSWRWAKWSLHAIRVGGLKDHTVPADGLTPFGAGTKVLDVPGALRPVMSTGHTSGHASYLVGDTGVLLSGDAVVTGHMVSPVKDVPQLLADPYHADVHAAHRTAEILLDSNSFDVLAPGHGDPIRVPEGGRLALTPVSC